MKLDTVFHALIAILHQHQHAAASRLLKDPKDIALNKDVPNGARFKQWLTHDGDNEVFDFLRKHDLLVEEADEYKARNYALKLDRPTLREHLASKPILEVSNEQWVIGSFIKYALAIERDDISAVANLAGLPIHKDRFDVPPYFDEAMQVLSRAGYCVYSQGKAKWSSKIAPIMEARGLWVGNKTSDEVQIERLAQIWNTMPEKLKQLTLLESEYPNSAYLARFMGEYWRDDTGWTFSGEVDPDIFLDDAQGGHLPDAIDISQMVEDGLLSRA